MPASVTQMSSGQGSNVRVSVVIPAFNEEGAIGRVVRDVGDAMRDSGYTFEIVVVDDGSSDGTAKIAADLGARVIRRPVNGGSGAARKVGIEAALGDIVVMMDGDGTYAARDIPLLLQHFPEYDQVNGARKNERGTMKVLRIPVKWCVQKLASHLARAPIPDLNTGLKAFKREIMLKYLWTLPDGFSCVSTMTLAFIANGHAVRHVPVDYLPRIGKSKFRPVRDTLNYLSTVLRMAMYFYPLRVFLPVSGGLLAVGAAKSLGDFFLTGSIQESDIIFLVAGLLVGCMGLLADLIVAQQRR